MATDMRIHRTGKIEVGELKHFTTTPEFWTRELRIRHGNREWTEICLYADSREQLLLPHEVERESQDKARTDAAADAIDLAVLDQIAAKSDG